MEEKGPGKTPPAEPTYPCWLGIDTETRQVPSSAEGPQFFEVHAQAQ